MNKTFLKLTKQEELQGWAWMVVELFFLPSIAAMAFHLLGISLSTAMLNVVLFVINFAVVISLFRRYFVQQLRCFRITSTLLWVFLGLALYWLLSYAVAYMVLMLQPQHINENNNAVQQLLVEQPILMTIGTVVLVPVTEEILYRGLVFGCLYRVRPVLGFIGSTVVFSAVHVIGYIGRQDLVSLLISLLQYLPAGLALSIAYLRSGSLITPILIHATLNLFATLAMR